MNPFASFMIIFILAFSMEIVFSKAILDDGSNKNVKQAEYTLQRETRFSRSSILDQRSDYINKVKDMIIKAALREEKKEIIRQAQQFIEAKIYNKHLAPRIFGSFKNDFLTMRY